MDDSPIRQPLSPAIVREIAAQSGLSHAEFCVEQDETQFGSERLKAARAELERLLVAEAGDG